MRSRSQRLNALLHVVGSVLVSIYVMYQLWQVYRLLPAGLYFFWGVFCTVLVGLLGVAIGLSCRAYRNTNAKTDTQQIHRK